MVVIVVIVVIVVVVVRENIFIKIGGVGGRGRIGGKRRGSG